MTQEEKAKAYDEAIERANNILEGKCKNVFIYDNYNRTMIDYLLSELKESEDEKMREMAIKAVYAPEAQSCIKSWGINPDDVIAWLKKQGNSNKEYWRGYREGKKEILDKHSEHKKQGKQKPADNIKPKFRVGQTIKKEGFNLGFPIVKIEKGFYYNDMGDYFPFTDQDNWELVEQRPAWSEEDNIMANDIDYALRCQISYPKSRLDSMSSWIYNLKNRVQPQLRQEWSEEDELIFMSIIQTLKLINGAAQMKIDWLKSLKDRVQPKQEWSEEDKNMLQSILDEYKSMPTEKRNWLKSLRPQSKWKPSEEQIKILQHAIDSYSFPSTRNAIVLKSLYEQLKKLREE